jgi:hypothetical protein
MALGAGAGGLRPPATTMPGTTGPADRAVVAIPPVYPGTPPGFLRLPETQSTPVGTTVAPGFPGPGPVLPGALPDPRFPGPVPGGDRPVWSPARLEPAVGIDARGHVTSILEYTPGRFER